MTWSEAQLRVARLSQEVWLTRNRDSLERAARRCRPGPTRDWLAGIARRLADGEVLGAPELLEAEQRVARILR